VLGEIEASIAVGVLGGWGLIAGGEAADLPGLRADVEAAICVDYRAHGIRCLV